MVLFSKWFFWIPLVIAFYGNFNKSTFSSAVSFWDFPGWILLACCNLHRRRQDHSLSARALILSLKNMARFLNYPLYPFIFIQKSKLRIWKDLWKGPLKIRRSNINPSSFSLIIWILKNILTLNENYFAIPLASSDKSHSQISYFGQFQF